MTVVGDCVVRARNDTTRSKSLVSYSSSGIARPYPIELILARPPARRVPLADDAMHAIRCEEPILDPLPQTVPIDRIAERGKGGDAISEGEQRRFQQRRHDLCGALADCHPIGDIDFSLKVEHFALCPPHAPLARVRLNSSARIGCIARSQAPRTSDTAGSHFKRPANPVRGSVTRLIMSSGYSPNTRATAAAYTVGFSGFALPVAAHQQRHALGNKRRRRRAEGGEGS